MAIVNHGVIGSAEALSATSIAIPVTGAVPVTNQTVTQVLRLFVVRTGETSLALPVITDDAPLNPRYLTNNFFPHSVPATFVVVNSGGADETSYSSYEYIVYNALNPGDTITISFGSTTANYTRATAVYLEGVQVRSFGCTAASDQFGVGGGVANYQSNVTVGTGLTTIPGSFDPLTGTSGLFWLAERLVTASSLSFTGAPITTVDSWYSRGPNLASGLIGFLDGITNPSDFSGLTDAPTSGSGDLFNAAMSLIPGTTGIPYCVPTPGTHISKRLGG